MKTTKTVNEFEVIESDRIALVGQANQFIENVMLKHVLLAGTNGRRSRVYTAALLFLEKEFNFGASGVQIYDKVLEREERDDA